MGRVSRTDVQGRRLTVVLGTACVTMLRTGVQGRSLAVVLTSPVRGRRRPRARMEAQRVGAAAVRARGNRNNGRPGTAAAEPTTAATV